MLLYIITGQKGEFWKTYFNNLKLVYEIWGLRIKRGISLRKYYVSRYGLIVGTFIVLNHFRLISLKTPFRYYKSIEVFILRNIVLLSGGIVFLGIIFFNFTEIKLWFVSACPDPKEVIYPDYYYPYAIFLSMSGIMLVQLYIVMISKTMRLLLGKYRYELLALNLITVFVLITVHCTVAHEGLLYVWWMPDSYEMISFSNEEEIVLEYWVGELKYLYNQIIMYPSLLDFKLVYEWAYLVLYKYLQF